MATQRSTVRVAARDRHGVVHRIAHNLNSWGDFAEATEQESPKVAHCGKKMKVSPWGQNKPTNKPINCIACIARELKHEEA